MRIATRVAVFLVSLMSAGCALDKEGQAADDEDRAPDIVPDEVAPDVFEADTAEVAGEDAAEEGPADVRDESEPDESEPDEVAPDESADTSDTEEAEEFAEAEDAEGVEDAEDGEEFVDPCTLPEIPTTGIYLFYCPESIAPIDMILGRWVEREGAPNVDWGYDFSCRTPGADFLWCNLTSYASWSPATVYFNIAMASGALWACIADPPETPFSPYGLPRLWQNGTELTLTTAPNPAGGFNYAFRL